MNLEAGAIRELFRRIENPPIFQGVSRRAASASRAFEKFLQMHFAKHGKTGCGSCTGRQKGTRGSVLLQKPFTQMDNAEGMRAQFHPIRQS